MAKSKIIAAFGVAAALGVAALPMASYAAHTATDTEIQDTIKVKVSDSCKFTADHSADKADKEYDITATELVNGAAATTVGTHKFNVFCNNTSGYNVTATTTGLTSGSNTISFVTAAAFDNAIARDTDSTTEGDQNGDNYTSGAWTAIVSSDDSGIDVKNNIGGVAASGVAANEVASKSAASTDATGNHFTVTYKAYAGTLTKAGTYEGTVTYTLAKNS